MSEQIVRGRPDFANHRFGITKAKRTPKYVYSLSHQAMLIHKVAYAENYWYVPMGDHLLRLDTPKIIARTVCNQSFFIHLPRDHRKFRASFCEVPNPEAVLCGGCHGEVATFGKHGNPPCTKELAKVRLGCISRAAPAPRKDVK